MTKSLLLVLTTLLTTWPFGGFALDNETIKKEMIDDLATGDYLHFRDLLQQHLHKKITLDEVNEIAHTHNVNSLVHAVCALKKIDVEALGMSDVDLLSCAYFIYTLKKDIPRYYHKKATGLSHTVECDTATQSCFVVLDSKKAYIDKGRKKIVSKALRCNQKEIKVVARAEQTRRLGRELRFTKMLGNSNGLFKTEGFCRHRRHGNKYRTIYSKLYSPGNLRQIFRQNIPLSFYELVRVAFRIAKGLDTIHKQGIVHRDLGIKNYLIHIPKGKPGKRKVKACIADFGRARYVTDIDPKERRLQGNTTYVAPEGYYHKKLHGDDYYKIDVFAMGCVFYRLFYGEKPAWQDTSYVHDKRPVKQRYKEHTKRIEEIVNKRRKALSMKRSLTENEQFEYLILQMVETNPTKRPSAETVYHTLRDIFHSLS